MPSQSHPVQPKYLLSVAEVVEAIRSRGSDACDLRDAAHEAFHAIDVDLAPPWTRDRIHRALIRRYRGMRLWTAEVDARAAEQLVCARFEVETFDIEATAGTSVLEAALGRLPTVTSTRTAVRQIRAAMLVPRVIKLAGQITRLSSPDRPPRGAIDVAK